ncbi:tyrosine-type recombinase/integrase [Aeriscardovia aeriphila]|nr:tyrosine-type recombinase/integrase [Aeriscardovia aeriphila]NYI25341.1 integrase/recombinase XerD [Aeriscardovia aeriphila]
MPGPLPRPIPPTWNEQVTTWITWLASRGISSTTIYSWKHKLLAFAHFTQQPPELITANDIEQWLARNKSRNTKRADLCAMRSFYSCMTLKKKIKHDPSQDVVMSKRSVRKMTPAPYQSVMNLKKTTEPRIQLMVLLMSEMGLRRSEVSAVHAHDLNQELNGKLTLTIHGKGDKERLVPVSPRVKRLLLKQLKQSKSGWLFPSRNHGHESGKHLTGATIGKLVRQETGWSPHAFRRRFATDTFQATHNIFAVKELLGHANLAVTQQYLWTDQQELEQAMRDLNDWRTQQQKLIRVQ